MCHEEKKKNTRSVFMCVCMHVKRENAQQCKKQKAAVMLWGREENSAGAALPSCYMACLVLMETCHLPSSFLLPLILRV